jgi:phage FluMu protein Com
MATHTFRCDKCNTEILDKNSRVTHFCPQCKRPMRWVINFYPGNKEYGQTKWSDSLAINPSQIEKHKKLFPDIRVDKEGRLGFDNYKQHDNYLKQTGFEKLPQRIKPKGKKLCQH